MAGLSLKLLSVLILLEVVLGASLNEIHRHMTPEERKEVFQTAGTFVPPYKVVQIHSSKVKRNVNAGHLLEMNLGQKVKTWLTPLDGALLTERTPIYGYSGSRGLFVIPNLLSNVFSIIYENKALRMTVAIEEGPRGKRSISGIIGSHNLYVKPIPERALNKLSKKLNKSIDDEFESDHEDKSYHIVYEMPLAYDNSTLIAPLVQSSRQKRSNFYNSIVYPEILVVVDWSLVSKLGADFKNNNLDLSRVLTYLVCFWNGVDLKYRELDHPKYRLNVAGFVLAMGPNEFPFLWKVGPIDVDAQTTLDGSGTWLFKQHEIINIHSYDAAITMTARKLHFPTPSGDSIILGRANIGATCLIDFSQRKVISTGVVHDEGGFDGVHTAAHELGHLLGANHDGQVHKQCPHDHGFIMSSNPVLNSRNTHDWSWCSRNDFQQFLGTNPKCLWNKPALSNFPRMLPGQMMDANEQCWMYERTKAYNIDASICVQLYCNIYGIPNSWKALGAPAADGTPCGYNQVCIHGNCMNAEYIK